jgi:hypothetical protein
MSKMEEMAVIYRRKEGSDCTPVGASVGEHSLIFCGCDLEKSYAQGWKDCLKHSEEVKELAFALEEAVEALLTQHADIATYYEVHCIPTYDEVIASFNRHKEAREALSKFREKVGE